MLAAQINDGTILLALLDAGANKDAQTKVSLNTHIDDAYKGDGLLTTNIVYVMNSMETRLS